MSMKGVICVGFIIIVVVILFGLTTFPIGGLFAEHVSEFLALVAAIAINLFLSTVLFLLYNIQDYLKQLVGNKSD